LSLARIFPFMVGERKHVAPDDATLARAAL
jgi:hypothetical protein